MTVLLDTHSFIWFNLNDPKFTDPARRIVEDAGNRVLVSPASYWEIAIRISLGKFAVAPPYETFWRKGIEDNAFVILPIELRRTSQLLLMPFHHKDPFGRLLVAQALAEQIPLISSDQVLDSYGIKRVW